MTEKLIEFWEDYDEFYTNLETKGFSLSDLIFGNKFVFSQGKHSLVTSSKFDFKTSVLAKHFATLDWKREDDAFSKVEVDEKQLTVIDNSILLKNGKFGIGSYCNCVFSLTQLGKCIDSSTLRLFHSNNLLFTLGFESCEKNALVFGTSYGSKLGDLSIAGNTLFKFNWSSMKLNSAKIFVKAKNKISTGLLTIGTTKADKENSEDNVELDLKFVHNTNNKTQIGGSLSYSLTNNNMIGTFLYSHRFDKINLNLKVDSSKVFSVGVTSILGDLRLNASSSSSFCCVPDADTKCKRRHFVSNRFGLSAEYERI